MKNTYIIIAGIAVLAIALVWLLTRKKANDTTGAGNTGNGGTTLFGGTTPYSLGTLMNSPILGYSGASQGIGETNYNFITRRSGEGWKF